MEVCELYCDRQGRDHMLEFQVVRVEQKLLLSALNSEEDGSWTVDCSGEVHTVMKEVPKVVPTTVQVPPSLLTFESISAHYSDVLFGLGCLPGESNCIEVDKSVKPVQHQLY